MVKMSNLYWRVTGSVTLTSRSRTVAPASEVVPEDITFLTLLVVLVVLSDVCSQPVTIPQQHPVNQSINQSINQNLFSEQ